MRKDEVATRRAVVLLALFSAVVCAAFAIWRTGEVAAWLALGSIIGAGAAFVSLPTD